MEGLENNFPITPFEIQNNQNQITGVNNSASGFGQSNQCIWINNFNNPDGDLDDLVLHIDYSNPTDNYLSFDVAYTEYGTNYSDSLEVLASTDCGLSFQSLLQKWNKLSNGTKQQSNFYTIS